MKNALLLHGTGSNHTENWFSWLAKQFEINGYRVWVPDLPHADRPNIERYTNFLFANKNFIFNNETILVGHSSGAVAALGLLEKLPKDMRINAVYLISAFTDDLGWGALHELFINPLDYKKIQKHAKSFTLFHSNDDPYVPLWHAEKMQKDLQANLIIKKNQGHFNTEKSEKYREFPLLWQTIQKMIREQ